MTGGNHMRLVASKAACRRWTQQCDWFGVCAHCAHAHLDAGRHCDVWVLEGLEACELQRDMMNNEAYSNGWRLKLGLERKHPNVRDHVISHCCKERGLLESTGLVHTVHHTLQREDAK